MTSSHDLAVAGRNEAAPTSKYTAKRVSVAAFRMRSARPCLEKIWSPFASTVCSSMASRVTPKANESGEALSCFLPAASVASPSSPSSRK